LTNILEQGDLAILGTKHKDDFEPYWQGEKDWLCSVEFLPSDDLEARLYSADIIGRAVRFSMIKEKHRKQLCDGA
jgi:hypothetical protein